MKLLGSWKAPADMGYCAPHTYAYMQTKDWHSRRSTETGAGAQAGKAESRRKDLIMGRAC